MLLQHGTILYDIDVAKMFSVLKISKEKISDKMIQAVEERVTSVKSQMNDIDMHHLHEALVAGFTQDKDHFFESLTSDEMNRAEELAEEKYASYEWNYMR